jgi:hypothetical protein
VFGAFCYAISIVLAGYGLTTLSGCVLRFEERLALAIVCGSVSISVIGLGLFVVFGMNIWTALGPLVLSALVGVIPARRRLHELQTEYSKFAQRLRLPFRSRRSARPLVLLSIVSAAVAGRILSLSYQYENGVISAGSLAVWGDWSAHLAYAGSFAFGDNRGFQLPIASGTPFKYHFLADFFSALFTPVGATLPQGLAVATWMFAVAFPILLWSVTMRLFRSQLAAAVTVLIFTLNGGSGFLWLIKDFRLAGWEMFVRLPRTYARIPEAGILVDNAISASLYAQRSTQMGLTIALACLLIILVGRVSRRVQPLLFAGLLLGTAGIAHAHTLLTGLTLGTLAWIVERRREWLWFLLSGALVGLPLSWVLLPSKSSVRFEPGWISTDFHQQWVWFWIRNLGFFPVALLLVSVFGGVPDRIRRLYGPFWLWFVVPNVISFHPASWNNTKYFIFWQLSGSIVLATFLSNGWNKSAQKKFSREKLRFGSLADRSSKLAVRILIVIFFVSLTFSGLLDTVRAMQRSSAIPISSTATLELAEWIRDNTETMSVLVQAPTNTALAGALSGRQSLSGYPGWTWDLSLPDWHDRELAAKTILAGGPTTMALVKLYGVTHVIVGPEERTSFAGADDYWVARGKLVVTIGEYRLYQVQPS